MLKPNMIMCYVEALFAKNKDQGGGIQLEAIDEAIDLLIKEREKIGKEHEAYMSNLVINRYIQDLQRKLQ